MTSIFRGFTNGKPLLVAMMIIGIWAISLWNCLQLEIGTLHPILLVCLIGWQTWIWTGLFITAHDAIHGSIHASPRLNRSIGQLCLWLYAGFDYGQLSVKHHLHHQYPASDRDPDFHAENAPDFWNWYRHFVCEHLNWRQILNLAVILMITISICKCSPVNLLLFWVMPSLLSSLQLFYFGTFLPHREPEGGYSSSHRAETIARSRWWSLISCYHFGYHHEHHESPEIPWWRLYCQ